MRKIFLLFLVDLLLISNIVQAQNSLPISQVEILLKEMKSYLNQDKLDLALDKVKKALVVYQRNIAVQDSMVAEIHSYLAEAFLDLGEYERAKMQMDSCLIIRQNVFGEISIPVAEAYHNFGLLYDYQNQLEVGISFYQKAINIYHVLSPKDNSGLGITYFNLGICYALLEDYSQAILYTNKTLEIDLEKYGEDHPEVGSDYNNLGILYNSINDLEKSQNAYLESRRIMLLNGKGKSLDMAYLLHNLGVLAKAEKNYPQAITHLQQALAIRQNLLNPNDSRIIKNQWVIAMVYLRWQKYSQAIQTLNKALHLAQSNENTQWETIEDIYRLLGETHLAMGELAQAEFFIQKAQTIVFADSLQYKESQNSRKLNIWADLLVLKAETRQARFTNTQNVALLQTAQKLYVEALDLHARARNLFRGTQSKTSWLEKQYGTFEKAIACNFQLAKITNDSTFLVQAFDWAAQSRALVLLDALQETKAERFAGIPDDLLRKEKDISKAIAEKEQAIFTVDTDSLTIALNGDLFDLHKQHDSLVYFLEQNYPNYFQLKYQQQHSSLEEIQQNVLATEQGLLQYFVGDNSIFIFLLSPNNFIGHQMKNDFPLEEWIAEWRQEMGDFGRKGTRINSTEDFAKLSFQLYEKLLAPIAVYLPPRLVIVADGVLGYLPFDALLCSKPKKEEGFRDYDYFLHHHQVAYAFSAAWWKDTQRPSSNPAYSSVLALAPVFDGTPIASADRSTALGALRFNREEAQAVVDIWGGRALKGEEATEARFREMASQYQILHLATHAKANDQSGDYSYLAFSGMADSLDNERLYARELYELSLQAELVVLSACETGIGELKKGEGIISLARGFSYAGVRSLLTTLWRVSDDKAAKLMIGFYELLKEGLPKDKALQQSKLTYLSNCREREAHPFYWAAFIPMGNMTALKTQTRLSWTWLGIVAMLLVVGGFWYQKNSK